MAKKKILIVDDELMLLLSMQRMLENEYDISIAVGGREAINLINKRVNQFDLIICDIYMPDMNGMKFYLDIAQNHQGLEKHVIFMTGANITPEIKQFIVDHKNICLSKPFESDQLLNAIKDFFVSAE